MQRDAGAGFEELMQALRYSDEERAIQLLKAGASVHDTDVNGNTPLHIAARNNLVAGAESLLASGADINVRNRYGSSPLHRAAYDGSVEVAKILVASGADIDNQGERSGLSPLHRAVRSNHLEMVAFFLQAGAAVDSRTRDGETPYRMAERLQCRDEIRETLAAYGANIRAKKYHFFSIQDPAFAGRMAHFFGIMFGGCVGVLFGSEILEPVMGFLLVPHEPGPKTVGGSHLLRDGIFAVGIPLIVFLGPLMLSFVAAIWIDTKIKLPERISSKWRDPIQAAISGLVFGLIAGSSYGAIVSALRARSPGMP